MNGASPAASKLAAAVAAALPLTVARCLALLQSYTQTRSLLEGKQLHACIITSGLFPTFASSPSAAVATNLLPHKLSSMYALSGDIDTARHLFDRINLKRKTSFLYNTLARCYLQNGIPYNALQLFEEMISNGDRPDKFTFTFTLKACADLSLIRAGVQVHGKALVYGFASDGYVQNSLIAMYMRCGEVEKARMFFDQMCDRTVVSWNTVITGLSRNGCAEEALTVFDQMVHTGVTPDCATVVLVLSACASVKDLKRGKQVHELVDVKEFGGNVAVRNALIDMYAKCGSLVEARLLLDESCQRDVVSWTAMIGGYVLHGYTREALSLSHHMMLSGIRPNAVTMALLLSACAGSSFVKCGKCFHSLCIRLSLEVEIIVETALIVMYGKCGEMGLSSLVFAESSRRIATWNAIISGYTQNGKAREAIEQFKLMQKMDIVQPDVATIVSVLPAYSVMVDLQQAKNIHCYLIKTGFLYLGVEVTTSLIDVYSKTGNLEIPHELFDGLPSKDIVSWSAIISGYGMHGHARTAISLFSQMVESGVEPNQVTFTSILYSCSHAGFVDEGLQFFRSMVDDYGIKPQVDHYACIVDLLGRAGRLDEAHGLIKSMNFRPNHAVWGALLGACVIHENVELGEEAAGHLFDLEPGNTGNYVLLGNIYAAVRRWKDAETVRSMVKGRGLEKDPGCSLIEVTN